MNPFDALADFVLGKIKEGIWAEWLKFLFELGFSAVVSFLFICGSLLAALHSPTTAIGGGMVAASLSLTVLFRRESSKLTRGMLVVLPAAEAEKEIESDFEVIQKSSSESQEKKS